LVKNDPPPLVLHSFFSSSFTSMFLQRIPISYRPLLGWSGGPLLSRVVPFFCHGNPPGVANLWCFHCSFFLRHPFFKFKNSFFSPRNFPPLPKGLGPPLPPPFFFRKVFFSFPFVCAKSSGPFASGFSPSEFTFFFTKPPEETPLAVQFFCFPYPLLRKTPFFRSVPLSLKP